jgi:hypothetical protein
MRVAADQAYSSPIRASNNMQLSSLSRILGMGADAETQQLQHNIIGSGPITSAFVLLEALPMQIG